jgi:hypothetical protein
MRSGVRGSPACRRLAAQLMVDVLANKKLKQIRILISYDWTFLLDAGGSHY